MNARPQHLGKYELIEHLERGGMGAVWKAYDTQLRRYVAIKLLNADLQTNPNFVSLFIREAQFVASLHHPNIVQVHDFQINNTEGSESNAYMVMDFVEGGTLTGYIQATSRVSQFPPAADIVYLFTAIGLDLDYAHQRGMIHRDIKPANILLDKRNPFGRQMGEPILTDFGIARLQGNATSTLTGLVVGTPRYISPEQAKGDVGDERSDLYSLGIILYELVTGTTPFRGDNPLAIMMQHIYETPPDPVTINPNISPALSAVVLQSIAKEPEQRFPTAAALAIALAHVLNVPVPASLHTSTSMKKENDYNPLQPPDTLTDINRTLSNSTASHPLAFTPSIRNSTGTEYVTPVHHTPTPLPMGNAQPSPAAVPSFPLSPPSRRKRWLYLAVIACSITLLLGVGIGTLSLLTTSHQKSVSSTTPSSAGTVVGWIAFSSSKTGTHDQLEVYLQNIPAPPAGKTYYAWLDTSGESVPTSWHLCNNAGTMHCSYSSAPQSRNLLAQYDWFIITEEDVNTTPTIPYPDAAARRYYVLLSHDGTTRFNVKTCPASGDSSAPEPCRI